MNLSYKDQIDVLMTKDLVLVQRDTLVSFRPRVNTGTLKGPDIAYIESLWSHYVVKNLGKTYNRRDN